MEEDFNITTYFSKITQKQNTLETLNQNLKSYLSCSQQIIINFEQISTCLNSFFHPKSVYFKPYILFADQLRAISMNLRAHVDDFRGLENRVQVEQMKFSQIRKSYEIFKNREGRVDHYAGKIAKLEEEKRQLEYKGKTLGKRKITRIIRVSLNRMWCRC